MKSGPENLAFTLEALEEKTIKIINRQYGPNFRQLFFRTILNKCIKHVVFKVGEKGVEIKIIKSITDLNIILYNLSERSCENGIKII